MNNSGRAVLSMMTRYALALEDIIIVADDINLPVGTLRIRRKGSCGGHRGLDSIAQHIGSKDFARLRVGVGSPEGVAAEDYVLEDFRE